MKYITLRDFYLKYPYKCYDVNSTTIPIPYIKREEVKCSDEFSRTFKEYSEICDVIFDEIQNNLIEGTQYKLPNRMGILQMLKYKTYRKVIFENKDGVRIRKRVKSPATGEYYPLLKWLRGNKVSSMWTKWHFKIRIMSNFSKKIRAKIIKQPSILHRYSDSIKINYNLVKDEKLRSD